MSPRRPTTPPEATLPAEATLYTELRRAGLPALVLILLATLSLALPALGSPDRSHDAHHPTHPQNSGHDHGEPTAMAEPGAKTGSGHGATHDSATCPMRARMGHDRHAAGPGTATAQHSEAPGAIAPSEVGQATFAALAEMAAILAADPSTDWSKVDLDGLREHLVDMDRVLTEATVEVTDLEDGYRARVTATDPRTAAAIARMVPAHAGMMDGHRGWRVSHEPLEEGTGVLVTVRAADPAEAERARGLGFAGFLVAGDHHRPHHLALARGDGMPGHGDHHGGDGH